MIRKLLWTLLALAVVAGQWLMLFQGKILLGGIVVVAVALVAGGWLGGPWFLARLAQMKDAAKNPPAPAATDSAISADQEPVEIQPQGSAGIMQTHQILLARYGWAYKAMLGLGALFLVGQGLLFSPWPGVGGLLCLAALTGILLCLKFKFGVKLPNLQWLVILGLALVGQAVVKNSFLLGMLLFATSGGLLAFWGFPRGQVPAFGAIPAHPPKFRWWEPLFLLVLIALAFGTRFYQLGEYPTGGFNQEGEAVNFYIGHMDNDKEYWPHTTDGDLEMPTLTYYQGFYAVKKLGWGIGHLRIPSALWGAFSILIFFFMARRLTSPGSAAVASILYTASFVHLGLSRIFFPYSILWVSVTLGFGLLLVALARKNWFWFCLAGLALGLSFHGYYPGRGVFLIALFWMASLLVLDRKSWPAWHHHALLWVFFFLAAAPDILWGIANWKTYNAYISYHADSTHGIWNHVVAVFQKIPLYAPMFHTRSDNDMSLHLAFAPVLDPFTGMLAGVGFFLCLAAIRQPVPLLLLAMFLAGLVPAMMGTNYAHPTVRRILLSLPAIYLIACVAFERFRRHPWFEDKKWIRALVVIVGLGAAGLVLYQNVNLYFGKFCRLPGTRIFHEYRSYLASRAAAEHPGFIYCQPGVLRLVSPALYPRKTNTQFPTHQEQLLVLNPQGESLLLLEGYMEAAMPFFQKHFPHAEIKVYRETDPSYKKLSNFWIATDVYNLPVYLVTVLIPAEDTHAFQDLWDVTDAGKPVPAHAFGPGFTGRPGQHKALAGAVLTDEGGTFQFQMGWPGWTLTVDNVPRPWNQPLELDGGIHYIRISGTVPAQAEAVPLAVQGALGNLAERGRVVALLPETGMKLYFTSGSRTWTNPIVNTRQEVFPMKRFYDPLNPGIPCSARCEFTVRVPQDGKYQFSTKEFSSCRLEINGQTVFDSYENPLLPKQEPIALQAGVPAKVKAYFVVDGPTGSRLFWLHYRGPDSGEQQWVPFDWIQSN